MLIIYGSGTPTASLTYIKAGLRIRTDLMRIQIRIRINLQLEIHIFLVKICNSLILRLGLHKNAQPTKEAFTPQKRTSSTLLRSFLPSRIRIRNQHLKLMRIHADPDPQPGIKAQSSQLTYRIGRRSRCRGSHYIAGRNSGQVQQR
jgi:hypothetical protein